MRINYDGKRFCGVANSDNGEVSSDTVFTYHQQDSMLWGEYSGGSIHAGDLRGVVHADGSLEFLYHHLATDGRLQAGRCLSTPELDHEGRVTLHERWQWLTGDRSKGESIVREQ